MLNIVDIGQSVTREAFEQSSLSDLLTAAAPTAKPAHAGNDTPLDAAGRGFSPADEYAVIDVDAHSGGSATFKLLIKDFPRTAATQPKRGHGRLFYSLPPGVVVQSGGVALGPGLTLQSSRGSSICARSYVWATDDPVAAAPQWLLARIGTTTTTPQSPQHMTDATAPTAHAAATAPCINSHQTEDNMPAHDASNSEARVQAAAKSAAPTPTTDLSLWGQETTVPESKSAAVVKADEWIFSEDSPNAEGDGQYDTAVSVAARVCGFGVNREEAVELLSDWNALACTPGLCPADIRSAVQTAYSDRKRDGSAEPTPQKAPKHTPGAGTLAASSKLEAALDAARRGFSVFPLKHYVPPAEDTAEARKRAIDEAKEPVDGFVRWQFRATTDEAQIRQWWTRWPQANIAGVTEGRLVVDVDPKNGGDDTYAELSLIDDFPNTLRTKTPSGGSHHVYALPDRVNVRGSVGEIGIGIDIRASGNYIVLPGSSYEGRPYEWANDAPTALAPQWLIATCKKPKPKSANAGKRVVEEDDTSIELAKKYLKHRAPVANEGTRNNTAVVVANGFYDYGVSKETCVELLWQWNETHCFPPLGDPAELEQVAASAPGSRIKPIGCSHPLAPGFADESESMKPLTPAQQERQEIWKAELEREAQQAREAPHAAPLGGMATPLRRFDPATLAPTPWVVRGLAARRAISTLTGPGGMSKSTWTLILAVACASGRSDISGYPMTKRECVWVWSQEDDIDQMELRVAAIMQAFGVSHDDMLDENGRPMLYLNSGVGKGKRLNLAKRAGERIIDGEHLADLMAEAKAIGASLVILDPLITLHQASENDNVQMRAVLDLIGQVAVEANCAVLIVSHTGKPDKASSKGYAGDAYASRGASAQPDAGRANVTFMGMSEADTKAWHIPENASHLDYVRIDDAKFNIGKKRREPRWFKREEVVVCGFTGDSMEVLRPVELEAKAAGRPDLLEAIAKAMADNLPPATPHATAAVAAHLPASMAAAIKGQNRARTINEAFGGEGVNEYLTNSGTLRRAKGAGNKGTIFTLLLAPQITA